MLDKVFFTVLSMALSASFVILVVLAARFALKKAPKAVSCALWGVVLFRLLCPVSFESMLSLQRIRPDAVKPQIVYQAAPQIESGIEPIDRAVNAALPAGSPQASVNPLQIWTFAGEMIWLSGIVTLLLYSIVTLSRLRKRIVGAVLLEDNVWLCDGVETPFVLGMLKPKIYLPSAIDAHERDYILLHECTHIRRGDNVVKPVFFLTLCVYWFNPLVWLAFFLCGRDMELSCDETVMKRLGADTRCDYSASLLRLSTGKRIVAGAPLAFGEGSVKGRIKNVLNYKKPAFWAVWLSVAAVAVLCFSLIANPKSANASTVVYFAPLSEGYAFTLRLPDSCQSFIANGSFTADEGGVKTFYAGGFHDGTGAAAEGDALFRLIARTADSYAARSDTDPNARFLGTCGGYTVYAVFSDGSQVSAAHKGRYDKMLADLKAQLTADSFSSTSDGIYTDAKHSYYLQLPASWKGRYNAVADRDSSTIFMYSDPSAQEDGFPDEKNVLFRLTAEDTMAYLAERLGRDPIPQSLGTIGDKTLYIRFPNGKTEGTSHSRTYLRMLADAKKLSDADLFVAPGVDPYADKKLQTAVSFTATVPTQEEFEQTIGTSGLPDPRREDFLFVTLSVQVSNRNAVDAPSIEVPDLPAEFQHKQTINGVRYWYGRGSSQDSDGADTSSYEYDLCLYRRGVPDGELRKAFSDYVVTVKYRLKDSASENVFSFPLGEILAFK